MKNADKTRDTARKMAVEELMIRAAEGQPARLGRLDDALLAFANDLGRVLEEFGGRDVVSSLREVRYVTCDEGREAASGILAVAEARPWVGEFFVAIDRSLMAHFLGAILGGAPEDADAERPLTPIERRIALRLLDRTVVALAGSLASLRKVSGRAVELRRDLTESDLGASGDRCVAAIVDLAVAGSAGALHVMMPFGLFGPDLDMLARPVAPRPVPEAAAGWRDELSNMIASANVKVTAVMGEGRVRLGDALAWKPGETLDFSVEPDQPATVVCSGRTIFRGAVGRRANGAMALQITEEIETGEINRR